MKRFFLLCVSRAGTCLGTMAFAGALPTIRDEWRMDAISAGSIQAVFSISNACALFAASWLCDFLGARRVYLAFSWLGMLALLLFACFAQSYNSALILMIFIGLTQGGIYTPAIILAMEMNSPRKRGYAVGSILAAGSMGYFLSVFIASWGAMVWGASSAFWLCTIGALVGAMLGSKALLGYADTIKKNVTHKAPNRPTYSIAALLLLAGYIGHCWELLGNWAWTPSIVAEALYSFKLDPMAAGLIVASTVHLSGMFSTLIIGTVSDYFNRISVLIFIGAAGALSSLLLGVATSWGPYWILSLAFIGSFFILGDSGVLSTALAENVPPEKLGSIMGIRSLLGFGIGSLAPLSFGIVIDTTQSWGIAYTVLAFGGSIAFISALFLRFKYYKIN